MANVFQAYEILNDAVAQRLGADAYDTIDASNLVSVGEQIVADGNIDVLGLGLLDRIGAVILENRKYKSKWRFLAKNEFEWGAIVEKVHTKLIEAQANSSYGWQNGTAPDPYEINLADTEVKLFKNIDTWEIPLTVMDKQIKTAFTSAQQFESFISSLFTAMENSIEFYFESMAITTFNTAIAMCKQAQDDVQNEGIHVIDLLGEYNAIYTDNAIGSVDEARYDEDFLKYAVARILETKSTMESFNVIYNIDGYERFTPAENLQCIALTTFAEGCKTHMSSDIYHNDLVQLPTYTELAAFQNLKGATFADKSKIKQFVPGQNPTSDTAIEVTGVCFVLVDDRGIGAMLRDQHTTSQRNNRGEYTNYWAKGEIGNFIDTSEQMVVFVMNEPS